MDYNIVYATTDTSPLLQQEICVNLRIDEDENFLNYASDSDEPDKESALCWLVRECGIKDVQYRLHQYAIDNEKECYDGLTIKQRNLLKQSIEEFENNSCSCSILTFLVKMTLEEYIKLKENEDCYAITIKEKTYCGLYDSCNGGGSLLDIELPQDITVRASYFDEVKADLLYRYSVKEVWGIDDNIYTPCTLERSENEQ